MLWAIGLARSVITPSGRLARLVSDIGLVAWGCTQRDSATGLVPMVVGLSPVAAGAFDRCLISAILGGPISGARIRKRTPSS